MNFLRLKNPVAENTKPAIAQPSSNSLFVSAEDAAKRGRITSRLAAGGNSTGNLHLKNGLHVMGNHEGNIICENGVVWISDCASIKGNVSAQSVYIQGKVDGGVKSELLVVQGKGCVSGEIYTNRILYRDIEEASGVFVVRPREKSIGSGEAKESAAIVPISSASVSAS